MMAQSRVHAQSSGQRNSKQLVCKALLLMDSEEPLMPCLALAAYSQRVNDCVTVPRALQCRILETIYPHVTVQGNV